MKSIACAALLAFAAATTAGAVDDEQALRAALARYAAVALPVDVSVLPEPERKALAKLVEAARLTDALFQKQVWPGNEALKKALAKDDTAAGSLRRSFFRRNAGPWDRLNGARLLVVDAPEQKPQQAGFYPQDAAPTEVSAWIASLSAGEQARAQGLLTVVRRDRKAFKAVPYAVEYKPDLARIAKLVKDAAGATADPALKKYLDARAKALLDDDYERSDGLWVDLDSAIDPLIGPYEVAEDGWFSSKAAYQAVVGLKDLDGSLLYARLSARLKDLHAKLPLDAQHQSPRFTPAPNLRVVNVVVAAGDADRGAPLVAFRLPNDERVLAAKGSKQVVLKNVMAAKFDAVVVPIARATLLPDAAARLSFDVHFAHALLHELAHGLGPRFVRVAGMDTTTHEVLGEAYGPVEEAKAEAVALWGAQVLVDQGALQKKLAQGRYETWLATSLRALRFGANEDHGRGVAIVLSTLIDKGAVKATKDGALTVDAKAAQKAITGLVTELLLVMAQGDAAAARRIVAERGKIRTPVERAIARLTEVPVDVAPVFITADELSPPQ